MFLSFFFINALSYGFSKIQLIKNSETIYGLSRSDFYFSIHNQNSTGFKFRVKKGNESRVYSHVKPWQYNKVEGDSVAFITDQDKMYLHILELEHGTCGDVVLSANIENYITLSYYQNEPPGSYCLFFYQPGNSYRVFTECSSSNYNTICYLQGAHDIESGNEKRCRANSTCGGSLTDGFLVSARCEKSYYVNITTRVILMKGTSLNDQCGFFPADSYDVYGNQTLYNSSITTKYACHEGSLHIGLAVSLVAIMLFIIICGCLMYYMCRPNREAYESSSGKRKKKNRKQGTSNNYSSHGFDNPLLSSGRDHL